MKISTKGQYALRMMLDLSVNNTGEYITIKSIARRQNLPEKYLEQIMTALSRGGYVKSVRGANGGYRLANNPINYTVGEILRTIEGSLSPVACLDDEPNNCSQKDDCVFYGVWSEISEAVNHVVDNITLEDLVNRKKAKDGYDYMI